MRNLLLVCLLVFFGICPNVTAQEINCATNGWILPDECTALLDLYDSTDGLGWDVSTGWKTNSDPCTWYGIICEEVLYCTPGTFPPVCTNINRVKEIDLNLNSLSGEIPTTIGNLTNLTKLFLYQNSLTGEIPSTIGNLTNLYSLHWAGNYLTGQIPSTIGNLINLENLHLFQNSLTGEIPSTIGNLTNLRNLTLYGNKLIGQIPSTIGDLNNLNYIYLFSNDLTGNIPPEIGKLAKLRRLWLDSNQLSGVVLFQVIKHVVDNSVSCYFNDNNLCIPDTDENLALGEDPICYLALSNSCTDVCGDGILTVSEECDDDNIVNGDGCSSGCNIETDWNCSGNPSQCTPVCVTSGPDYCNDNNLCTTDSCDPSIGCVNTNNTSPCDDGDACSTNDVCSSGACTAGPALDCNDANTCTNDSCDLSIGCVNTNNTKPCDDNNLCTTGDACDSGACVGIVKDCDDQDDCTDDQCELSSGSCTYQCAATKEGDVCCSESICKSSEVCEFPWILFYPTMTR